MYQQRNDHKLVYMQGVTSCPFEGEDWAEPRSLAEKQKQFCTLQLFGRNLL